MGSPRRWRRKEAPGFPVRPSWATGAALRAFRHGCRLAREGLSRADSHVGDGARAASPSAAGRSQLVRGRERPVRAPGSSRPLAEAVRRERQAGSRPLPLAWGLRRAGSAAPLSVGYFRRGCKRGR